MPQSFADQLRSIPMSPNLGQSLERAHRFARDQSHRLVTLEHLLLALIEDAEAALILQSANVDLARLGTDVSSYLGGLLEDMRAEPGAEPKPDPELLRVLQAAASAAQQSKRKQIDGAIVLAAVVGDGKSPPARQPQSKLPKVRRRRSRLPAPRHRSRALKRARCRRAWQRRPIRPTTS